MTEVQGTYGGAIKLGHGAGCVITWHDSVPPIMTPDEARLLARFIERQAAFAEKSSADTPS